MKKCLLLFSFLSVVFLFTNCSKDGDGSMTNPPAANLPTLSVVEATSTLEGTGGETTVTIDIELTGTYSNAVTVNVKTYDASALSGLDFVPIDETITFTSPETKKEITLNVVADEAKEGIEFFYVQLQDEQNANTGNIKTKVVINNDDADVPVVGDDGYATPDTYPSWKLAWSDEFSDAEINRDNWTFEMGDGCPNLCNWGNNERQWYSDQPENARTENGNLIIEAQKSGSSNYTSARMISKDKQNFGFGRIDIRAKMPEGQGIWPALWMLGKNIDAVGWPACGELDIMELVGHKPNTIHGTAHYGPAFPNNKLNGATFSGVGGDYSEDYHVFSLVKNQGSVFWYIDDIVYHEITPQKLGNDPYPFNGEFFMVMNIAVGGNWPGDPDETTVFPQQMIVDYVRYFERE